MRKLILGLIFLTLVIGALTKSPENTKTPPSEPFKVAHVAPEPLLIFGEERKPIVAAATKELRLNRDKIEKISFYLAKNPGLGKSRVEAYISLPDDMAPLLRMRTVYFGDDWVFYDSVKVMVDDNVVYERSFSRADVARDNSSGSVWETADFPADPRDLLVLHSIATAKSATIRFAGREHRHDHEITAKERKDIKRILDAYEQLRDNLVRKPETTST